jgi:hypothetical protein
MGATPAWARLALDAGDRLVIATKPELSVADIVQSLKTE